MPENNAKNKNKEHFDLIIIGGGPAGISAVLSALDAGAQRIALIEKNELGGACANTACVPTKTLLSAAKHLRKARTVMPQYGISMDNLSIDLRALMQKKDDVIAEGSYSFLNNRRVSVIKEAARFSGPNTIECGDQTLEADNIIIATGAKPDIPDIPGLNESGYIDFRDATQLETLPESLAIVGGGAVGIEFAFFFAELGSKVFLVEHSEHLLEGEEPEIGEQVTHLLESIGITVQTGATLKAVQRQNGRLTLNLENSRNISTEKLLMATGMKASLHSLNLEAAGVSYTNKGITVNDLLRSSNPNVYAIGDVTDSYRFTHMADYQAGIAVKNALLHAHETVDYHAVPWAIYTAPAIARVGLTEKEAREKFKNSIEVLTADVDEVSRYRIESETTGFIKLIIETATQTLVGAHVFAAHAEDIAQYLALAIQHNLSIPELLAVIYIYPSRTQLVQKALEKYKSHEKEPARHTELIR